MFHPAVITWFADTIGVPTRAQECAWAAIREGRHTLVAAPTGSGKTLAAFLTSLDGLLRDGLTAPLANQVRVVYVSPLKALSADIHKNLAEPQRGIHAAAQSLALRPSPITVGMRTGDTTAAARAALLRTPPHILVTTPESLYMLLTSARGRGLLATTRTVIVDEIHAVIGSRRGAHLALTLERLARVAGAPVQRIGLSATQRPIETVARFLVGTHGDQAVVVDEGHRRAMDLAIEVPRSPLDAVLSHEVWAEYFDRLAELSRVHRTTLVFVNTRRMAERIARQLSDRLGERVVAAHHGSLAKDRRLDAESRLKSGELRVLVATSSLELGIDIGHVDLVCQIGSPHRIATFLQRAGRAGHFVDGTPKARLFPVSREDLIECTALLRSVRCGELDAIVPHEAALDVLSQQLVAEASSEETTPDELFALTTRAWPYRDLNRATFDDVLRMAAEGFNTRRGRRGALLHHDEVQGRIRGRRGTRSLAVTSGGAIPDVADYLVVLDPEDIFVGTLNEDFAIESHAGDIFQLGNASWQITQVTTGVVRVVDARGAPPTIPFWLGEAPGRSDELSRAVSDLRRDAEAQRLDSDAIAWMAETCGVSREVAEQAVTFLHEGRHALGAMPTQQSIVIERFFDESGGMQLVLHAPFGSRVNRAWGLALRKRFCRQFNFELQAAATEDALLLSLGPQHSFPLADVARYLHPVSVKEILVQALLDAPVFQTRWRWSTALALAVPRNRNGKKVAPQLQRMLAEDLMAAVFPDAAACLENIPGDRQVPDHPLVTQAVHDCLQDAMDCAALEDILGRLHRGEIAVVARDTTEPSPFAHAILNAQPYAFLDDAPLEERRTRAVFTRRAGEPGGHDALAALDEAAILRVRDEARPDVRDADELHDALMTCGFLTGDEAAAIDPGLWRALREASRTVVVEHDRGRLHVATERWPEISTIVGALAAEVVVPRSRQRQWPPEAALVEIIRGRMTLAGPTTSQELAAPLAVSATAVERALETLEGEGVVLRGRFRAQATDTEWCERTLLARIHRYTLNRLRAEIEPVTQATFMRFLFEWQHAGASRLSGAEGLAAVLTQLDGYELAAGAWEREVLPARLDTYDSAWLDTLCLTGRLGWLRLTASPSRVVKATPIALFVRERAGAWKRLTRSDAAVPPVLSADAQRVLDTLTLRGASFAHELADHLSLTAPDVARALSDLVAAGLVTSDGFAGLRGLVREREPSAHDTSVAGRWAAVPESRVADEADLEGLARALLARYGIICRRLLTREPVTVPWRSLLRAYRTMEARGEVRGGRFVTGVTGEQFALPDAVQRLREVRRTPPDDVVRVISAADPLNLTGIVTTGERVPAVAATRIAYRNGVPLAALEGDYVKPLADIDPAIAADVASALAGRRMPPVVRGFLGRVS